MARRKYFIGFTILMVMSLTMIPVVRELSIPGVFVTMESLRKVIPRFPRSDDVACPLAHRKTIMDEYCAKHHPGAKEKFINGGFVGSWIATRLVVDDLHKVIFCPVPKVGVTTWRVFFMKASGYPSDDWTKELNGTKRLAEYTRKEAEYRLKTYMKIMIARHPFDRLVSGYNDKFIQEAYKAYLRPTIMDKVRRGIRHIPEKEYRRFFVDLTRVPTDPVLKEHQQNYRKFLDTKSENNYYRVNFTEFLTYISYYEEERNKHWETLENMCHPCEVDYDVILKVETIDRDSKYVIQKMGEVASMFNQTELQNLNSHRKTKITKWDDSNTIGYMQNIKLNARNSGIGIISEKPKIKILQRLREFDAVPEDIMVNIIRNIYWNDMEMLGYDFNMEQSLIECNYECDGKACC